MTACDTLKGNKKGQAFGGGNYEKNCAQNDCDLSFLKTSRPPSTTTMPSVTKLKSNGFAQLRRDIERRLTNHVWRSDMKDQIRDLVLEKMDKGCTIRIKQIVKEIIPIARERIPRDVYGEIYHRARDYIENGTGE